MVKVTFKKKKKKENLLLQESTYEKFFENIRKFMNEK